MNKAEHSASAAVRMLLVKALFERLIHESNSHEATYVILVLPKYKTSLILNLYLIVVNSRGDHKSSLLHEI